MYIYLWYFGTCNKQVHLRTFSHYWEINLKVFCSITLQSSQWSNVPLWACSYEPYMVFVPS